MPTILDPDRLLAVQKLYDPTNPIHEVRGGGFEGDFPSLVGDARSRGAVQQGAVSELIGAPYVDFTVGYNSNHYSVFSWEACNEVFKDNVLFSSAFKFKFDPLFGHPNLLGLVGDEHRRYRRLANPPFLRKRAQWWTDRFVGDVAQSLVSELRRGERMVDLYSTLCVMLPVVAVTRSFGIPDAEAIDFASLTAQMHLHTSGDAAREIGERMRPLIHARRGSPQDDLLSELVHGELDEGSSSRKMTDDEVESYTRVLLTAGLHTTSRQLGILLFAILTTSGLPELLRRDPDLIPQAIEESARWEPNVTIFRRLVTADVTLFGVDIPEGAIVQVCLTSANRDPDRWENPDSFDIFRTAKSNLGFGGGAHTCLGQHVARAEMLAAVKAVLSELPNLRIDGNQPAPRLVGHDIRSVTSLPVIWD